MKRGRSTDGRSFLSVNKGRGSVKTAHTSRKEARKQEREDRKKRKQKFFSGRRDGEPPGRARRQAWESPHGNRRGLKRSAAESEGQESEPKRKRVKVEKLIAGNGPPSSAVSGSPLAGKRGDSRRTSLLESNNATRKLGAITPLEKLAASKDTPISPESQATGGDGEDAYIQYLESKLGYTKGRIKKVDDGLDGSALRAFCEEELTFCN